MLFISPPFFKDLACIFHKAWNIIFHKLIDIDFGQNSVSSTEMLTSFASFVLATV